MQIEAEVSQRLGCSIAKCIYSNWMEILKIHKPHCLTDNDCRRTRTVIYSNTTTFTYMVGSPSSLATYIFLRPKDGMAITCGVSSRVASTFFLVLLFATHNKLRAKLWANIYMHICTLERTRMSAGIERPHWNSMQSKTKQGLAFASIMLISVSAVFTINLQQQHTYGDHCVCVCMFTVIAQRLLCISNMPEAEASPSMPLRMQVVTGHKNIFSARALKFRDN